MVKTDRTFLSNFQMMTLTCVHKTHDTKDNLLVCKVLFKSKVFLMKEGNFEILKVMGILYVHNRIVHHTKNMKCKFKTFRQPMISKFNCSAPLAGAHEGVGIGAAMNQIFTFLLLLITTKLIVKMSQKNNLHQ